MNGPRVVVASRIHRDAIRLLENFFDVVVNPKGRIHDEEWLCGSLRGAWGLVVTPRIPVTRRLLGCGEGLRIIAAVSSGYDYIDLEAAEEKGICVFNTPDPIAKAVAEYAVGMAIALTRNIVRGDRYLRRGLWRNGPAPREMLSTGFSGKNIGIVGLGRIGSGIAYRARCLGASRIIYWSRRRKPELEVSLGVEYRDLERLAEESDVIFVSVALTPETRHLINREFLGRVKRGAYLVNVARGSVVDTSALVWALKEGRLAGAALDVFEEEPLPPDHPLLDLENVILTPHMAGYTLEAVREAGLEAARGMIGYIRGVAPPNPLTSHCNPRP